MRLAGAVLANVLIWSGVGPLPRLRARGGASAASAPLADQGAAGNLMMIETGAVTLALFTWLFFRAANRSVEKQELLDLAERHGVELDPARPPARWPPGRASACASGSSGDGGPAAAP